jgi:hypothetical protein
MDQRDTIKGVVDLSRRTLALAGSALTTSSLVVWGILPVTPGFAAGQPPVVDASGPPQGLAPIASLTPSWNL